MLRHETKKILRMPILIGILFILAFKFFSVSFIEKNEKPAIPGYKEYLTILEGVLTPEKEQYILTEKQNIADILEKKDIMEADYLNEIITKEEYAEYNDQYIYAQNHQEAIEQLYADYEYLKAFEGTNYSPEFIYAQYWNHYFAPDTVDIILIFCLVFFACSFFSLEHTSNMWKIIHTTYRGKMKIIHTKILSCLCVSGVFAGIFSLIELIGYLLYYKLNHFQADIHSLQIFAQLSLHLSMGQGVFLLILWRTIAAALVSVVLFLISYLLQQDRINFFICFTLLIFPVFIKKQLPQIYRFTFYPLINGISIVTYAGENANHQIASIFCTWLSSIVFLIILYLIVSLSIAQRISIHGKQAYLNKKTNAKIRVRFDDRKLDDK